MVSASFSRFFNGPKELLGTQRYAEEHFPKERPSMTQFEQGMDKEAYVMVHMVAMMIM